MSLGESNLAAAKYRLIYLRVECQALLQTLQQQHKCMANVKESMKLLRFLMFELRIFTYDT